MIFNEMEKKLNVFILAAGLGERLRPITEHIPKPLLPIVGKPVLQSVLEKVSNLPVNKIGINLYHKKEAIEDWIKQSAFSKKVRLFSEERILGTGGALKNAERFLCNSTFLVHNSDVVSDVDLEELIEFHLSSENLVTLAVHDYPEFNNVVVDEEGFFKGIGRAEKQRSDTSRHLAFTGISVYSPDFLNFLPAGISSVVDAWLNVISNGFRVGTLNVGACNWHDIGIPPAYAFTVFNKLRDDGEMIYVHPSVEGCKDIAMNGYVVIEQGSTLNKGTSLRNCIILPGFRAESNAHYEKCILGPDFRIDFIESEVLGSNKDSEHIMIGAGGSSRKYYRVKSDKGSTVLMQSAADDPDFQRQIEYTRFFFKYSVPVPELIRIEADKMSALFEDLGDLSLYSWLKCHREAEEIEEMYRQVIDMLILVHSITDELVSECPLLKNRVFNYEHFRWETGYFIERFVKGIRKVVVKNISGIEREFHLLASKADSFSKTVIHRDFQSQNIMIKKGTPRLIDYQGARIGPPAYDLVSLLWDPYYQLKDDMRERLLSYYINRMRNRLRDKFSEKAFRKTILPCRLQRHMQALGAYGFLSTEKGKKYFLKYIPEGLRLLKEDLLLSKNEYPVLYQLVMEL